MSCSFTHAHYAECLRLLKDQAEFVHDIDLPPVAVERMACIEYQNSVRSTYFVRLQSPLYNALSVPNIRLWRTLIALDHDIGLHYEKTPDRIPLDSLAAVLSEACGKQIEKVSVHEPRRMGLVPIPSSYLAYGYGSDHYNGKTYISESGTKWFDRCMCRFVGTGPLVILTHPEWWFAQVPSENY